MSLIPKWKTPGTGFWGFDETSAPPWLGIGVDESKAMLLDFAAGKTVSSVNPRIASISDGGTEGTSRFFMISGKMPGRTKIEVRDAKSGALESVLAVRVKKRLTLRLHFVFVEDKAGDRTVRQPDILEQLIEDLNDIYQVQTNIRFELFDYSDAKFDHHLNDVIVEGVDHKSGQMTGDPLLLLKGEWRKFFVRHRRTLADFNIYFAPVDEPVDKNRNDHMFIEGDSCLIEDGWLRLDYLVAHAIGRMMGCPVTSDPNQINHLMFWDPGAPTYTFPRTSDFIPKHCANIMNP